MSLAYEEWLFSNQTRHNNGECLSDPRSKPGRRVICGRCHAAVGGGRGNHEVWTDAHEQTICQ